MSSFHCFAVPHKQQEKFPSWFRCCNPFFLFNFEIFFSSSFWHCVWMCSLVEGTIWLEHYQNRIDSIEYIIEIGEKFFLFAWFIYEPYWWIWNFETFIDDDDDDETLLLFLVPSWSLFYDFFFSSFNHHHRHHQWLKTWHFLTSILAIHWLHQSFVCVVLLSPDTEINNSHANISWKCFWWTKKNDKIWITSEIEF